MTPFLKSVFLVNFFGGVEYGRSTKKKVNHEPQTNFFNNSIKLTYKKTFLEEEGKK